MLTKGVRNDGSYGRSRAQRNRQLNYKLHLKQMFSYLDFGLFQ